VATTVDGGISKVYLSGFKSIENTTLELNNLNVFLGANGSGKSNFISFFQMLEFYLGKSDGLAEYVGRNGGAHSLLYFGTQKTSSINAELTFNTNSGTNVYSVEFGISIGDKLYFKDEKVSYCSKTRREKCDPIPLGSGGNSSRLMQISEDDAEYRKYVKTVSVIKSIMKKWCFYQFHNTTRDAYIRGASHRDDNNYLRSDGGNLASFLYMLRDKFPRVYANILGVMKQIAPYIDNLSVEEEYASPYIRLKWSEKICNNYTLEASQMSDGTLRAFALVTLLMQPKMPPMICIDEPELGLHPEAISIICDLIKMASERTQIILSTQSTKLIDCFEAEDIVVVDRKDGASCFSRLDREKYKAWLDEYSISTTWETNVFGGRP
jgi:predicted ATPase